MLVYTPYEESSSQPETLIGGKAYNLGLLTRAGFNVPSYFVVSVTAFQQMNDALRQEVEHALDRLNLRGKTLAVRSSAVGEDGSKYSFAGQLDSILDVSYDTLYESIEKVWQSAFGERIAFYRTQHHIEGAALHVAVIVQEMLEPDASGVAFGMDPITGDRNTTTICSINGVGDSLVSGDVEGDTFKVKAGNITSTLLHHSLNEAQARQIDAELRKIQQFYKRPQDVEWAFVGEALYILQARPITTLHNTPDTTQSQMLWDNSNIIESYSGVTTPLTFSFIQNVYSEVYKQFCRIMGVEEALINVNNDAFAMLGFIKGRVYYNLLSWYKVLALLPGYSLNARFMEEMMGVKEPLKIKPSIVQSKQNPYLRLLNLTRKLVLNLMGLPKDIKAFYQLLDATLSPYEDGSLQHKTPHELISIYIELEQKLLKKWDAPLVNDFYAMVFYGVLKQLLARWHIDDKGTLQNDLLVGDGEIISTEPVKRIRYMANNLHTPEFESAFQHFIKTFGNRCMGELKLETVTYKQDASPLMTMIHAYAKQGFQDLEKDAIREHRIRKESEANVYKQLGFNPMKHLLFKGVLHQARLRVRNRENLRFERTRLFGIVREIFLSMGQQFYAEGIIDAERDIFYLTKDEIFAFVSGTAIDTDLNTLIQQRKRTFQAYEDERPADRFSTYGAVYHANAYHGTHSSTVAVEGDLQGIGCCPGIVRAAIKIVRTPAEADGLEGCILVAERTDPGWVPLFPISKGLLIERGSILSHSAIVSREMGIPAIVGVSGLLNTLEDGEVVEMDGSTGVIKRLREHHA